MPDNLTALFLGDESTWDDVQFSVFSIHPLWGGYTISVTGRGTAAMSLVERGAQRQRRYELSVDPAEARALLRLAIAHDLLAVELPQRTSFLPDESMTTLNLTRDRRTFSLHVWSADAQQAGIKAIIAAAQALQRHTEGLTPAYEGPIQQ